MTANWTEIARLALGIGAQIKHNRVITTQCGQEGGEGRTVDTGKRTQRELGHGHQRAGIAGRDGGARRAVLHRLDGEAHGAATRLTQRLAGLVGRGDDEIGMDDLCHGREIGMILQRFADLRFARRTAHRSAPGDDDAQARRPRP